MKLTVYRNITVAHLAAFVLSLLSVNSCYSESGRVDSHHDDIHDEILNDVVYDLNFDNPEFEDTHPYIPQCGNGIIDEGEECDDRNRLNGDGCDWQCQIGDGESPPAPDETIDHYITEGDPFELEGIDSRWGSFNHRIPLVWNGSEYATAYLIEDGESYRIRFRRFDMHGVTIGDTWTYDIWFHLFGIDLVWMGSGYGLFFIDDEEGIFLLRLDIEGKPIGPPILVVDDPTARAPSADIIESGYILAWITEGSGFGTSWCNLDGYPDTINLRTVDFNGSTEGYLGPITVELDAGGPPDIVSTDNGFGLTFLTNVTSDYLNCSQKFLYISSDLSITTHSGILGDGFSGDVASDGELFYSVWSNINSDVSSDWGVCTASFSLFGDLLFAPVCNITESMEIGVIRFDIGDRGLAILSSNMSNLLYFRTDINGTVIFDAINLLEGYTPTPSIGPFAIEWADDHFGIIYISDDSTVFNRLIPY